MMKNNRRKISILLILLVLSMPIYASVALAEFRSNQITGQSYFWGDGGGDENGGENGGDENGGDENLPPAGESCVETYEETDEIAEFLDAEVISVLENVYSLIYTIYTTMVAIDKVLSGLNTIAVIGSESDDYCCNPAMLICPGPCGAPCGAMGGIYSGWKKWFHSTFSWMGCMLNCGWCTGQGCGGLFAGSNAVDDASSDGEDDEPFYPLNSFAHLSPFENIYVASACMCPSAILFNLRKLRTIYQTYNCCVEASCEAGIPITGCQEMLDEATCMYWEGSIYNSMIKIFVGFLSKWISQYVAELIAKGFIPSCALSLIELAYIPGAIEQVERAGEWLDRSFDDPSCSDLNFDDLMDELEETGTGSSFGGIDEITIYDIDGDGMYDSIGDGETYSGNAIPFIPDEANPVYNNHGDRIVGWRDGDGVHVLPDIPRSGVENIRGSTIIFDATPVYDFDIPDGAETIELENGAVVGYYHNNEYHLPEGFDIDTLQRDDDVESIEQGAPVSNFDVNFQRYEGDAYSVGDYLIEPNYDAGTVTITPLIEGGNPVEYTFEDDFTLKNSDGYTVEYEEANEDFNTLWANYFYSQSETINVDGEDLNVLHIGDYYYETTDRGVNVYNAEYAPASATNEHQEIIDFLKEHDEPEEIERSSENLISDEDLRAGQMMAARRLSWILLDETLGQWAYDEISEMCADRSEASE
jgi:hypothetical protein